MDVDAYWESSDGWCCLGCAFAQMLLLELYELAEELGEHFIRRLLAFKILFEIKNNNSLNASKSLNVWTHFFMIFDKPFANAVKLLHGG